MQKRRRFKQTQSLEERLAEVHIRASERLPEHFTTAVAVEIAMLDGELHELHRIVPRVTREDIYGESGKK